MRCHTVSQIFSPRACGNFTTRTGNATTTYRIRVVPLEGNPWFSLADCNRVLGRSQGGRKPVFIGSDERRTIREMNGVHLKGHGLLFVSESGLYKYIMRSDKPEARAFQEWVTREVLPTIPQRRRRLQDRWLRP